MADQILLTGASGYIGLATIRAFVAAGRATQLTALVRNGERAAECIEQGAVKVRVLADVADLPKVAPEYAVVLNTVGFGEYNDELEVCGAVSDAMASSSISKFFVHLSGTM